MTNLSLRDGDLFLFPSLQLEYRLIIRWVVDAHVAAAAQSYGVAEGFRAAADRGACLCLFVLDLDTAATLLIDDADDLEVGSICQ